MANYCIWHRQSSTSSFNLKKGCLAHDGEQDGKANRGTFGINSGKWYWEIIFNDTVGAYRPYIGVTSRSVQSNMDSPIEGGN
jgi:hypothetical protein